MQLLVSKICRRYDSGQDIERVEEIWVGHPRPVNEFLDFPASKLGPNTIVFALHLIACWMRRPIGADTTEVFKAYLHGTVAPIHNGVKRDAQTGDDRAMVRASRALRQHRQAIL